MIFNEMSFNFRDFFQVESHQEFNRTLKVTVKIQDVDNKNPKFERIHYKAEILENVNIFNGVKELNWRS